MNSKGWLSSCDVTELLLLLLLLIELGSGGSFDCDENWCGSGVRLVLVLVAIIRAGSLFMVLRFAMMMGIL